MKWKKAAVFGSMIMVCAALATGCGANTQEKNENAIQKEKQEIPEDGQQENGNPDGAPPAKPDNEPPTKQDGNRMEIRKDSRQVVLEAAVRLQTEVPPIQLRRILL